MRPWRPTLAIALLAMIIVFASPYPVLAQNERPPDEPALSPYWSPAVSRWEPIIVEYAQQRSLDPDLIAAVIWKESLGRPRERGPAGAVGLMGLMPFDWRPSPEELKNPWTNLFWGARALAHTIRDGNGDLYYALAAYNGSWEQVHLRVTRRYAAAVLDHYARAVAVRYELPADGDWIAIFAIEGAPGPNTITVIGPQRPLARYTERAWIQADIPTVPAGVPPHATAITFVDEQGLECQVNIWLLAEDGSPFVPPAKQTVFSLPPAGDERAKIGAQALTPTSTVVPTPTPTPIPTTTPSAALNQPPTPTDTPIPTTTPSAAPTQSSAPKTTITAVVSADGAGLHPFADAWWRPSQTLPAGTVLELIGYDPSFSKWVYVRIVDGASTGWIQTVDLKIDREFRGLPRVLPLSTLTLTSHTSPITPTLSTECEGGPLRLDSWDVGKVRTEHGWMATIFVEGHGGDCVYTYGWEGETKGGPMSGPMTFEVSAKNCASAIVGTVSVTSAGETVKIGLHIKWTDGGD